MISEQELLDIGFEKIPHFTVNNSIIYRLSRNRHLSIGNLGTPCEIMYICESDHNDYRNITDLVCLHNYDYDGYLNIDKVKKLIDAITN